MRVKDIMTASVDSIESTDTIAHASRRMAEDDVGALPILRDGKLVGIVTDRDIAVRGVAAAIPASASVGRIMTEGVSSCFPDDDVESVLALMSREQIRRMPVCDRAHGVVGIVGLTDAAKLDSFKKDVAETLVDICKPSGMHCQVPVLV